MDDLMASIGTEIAPMINSIIFTVLGLVGTWLGIQFRRLMNRMEKSEKIKEIKQSLELNKEIVKISVDYAEQIGKHLTGTEKFKLAKGKAYEVMNEWGVEISDSEVNTLIEQVVSGYNQEAKKKNSLIDEVNKVTIDSFVEKTGDGKNE